jgi:glucose-1-phosphate thymidylyltransferase
MKGIVLAGGKGTRLYPSTLVISKQLVPVYDKPMVYYPLSILLLSDIKDIMIISTPRDIDRFENLLGNGEDLGVSITYKIQSQPKGIAEAFILAKDFIGEDSVALILGDNIFYGNGLTSLLIKAKNLTEKGFASIFAYYVDEPERYGVVEFDKNQIALNIEEKPVNPKSNYCVTGLYFYDNSVVRIAEVLKPSGRGELEITDLNREYLLQNKLSVHLMGRGFTWLDTGTHESLLEASQFIHTLEKRQATKIAVIEEIAHKKGYIKKEDYPRIIAKYGNSDYGKYLSRVFREPNEDL